MPILDRQAVATGPATRAPASALPPSLQGLPPRSVPETAPTPLQKHYVLLSVPVLILGAIAITALELGASLGSPLVKLCVVIAAPLLVVTTADALLRIWRSAWAWMPVDRGKGLFRLAWVAVSLVGLAALVAAARGGHPRVTDHGFDRGPDGRSTDLPSGGGVPPWLAASLNFCTRCGSPLVFGSVPGEDRDRLACSACGHIVYVNPRLVVTTLPITDAGEIVLIRRGIEPGMGSWAQPGGFLEVDETVHQGAIRETFEETGLLVDPGEIVGPVHAPRGVRRHHRVRGEDRRWHGGPDPGGDRDRGLRPGAAPLGADRVQDDPLGAPRLAGASAPRPPAADTGRRDLTERYVRSMKTFFVSVYSSSADIPSSRPIPDIL